MIYVTNYSLIILLWYVFKKFLIRLEICLKALSTRIWGNKYFIYLLIHLILMFLNYLLLFLLFIFLLLINFLTIIFRTMIFLFVLLLHIIILLSISNKITIYYLSIVDWRKFFKRNQVIFYFHVIFINSFNLYLFNVLFLLFYKFLFIFI